MNENKKLANLSKKLETLSNDRKYNFFSYTYSERDFEHYDIIKHFLNPHNKHNLKDYFIKQIVKIIKDKYQINNENYMDLQVNPYHIPNEEYYDMSLELTAISMINRVFFIFLVETEMAYSEYTITPVADNFQEVLKKIDYIKQLYNTYQVIPILIIDSGRYIDNRYDPLYIIPFDKIINIMNKMLKKKIKDKYYKYIIKQYIKSIEEVLIAFDYKRDGVPWEKYLKIYSKYAEEINNIKNYGSTYYIKKILLYIFKNKSFMDNVTIMDCKIDRSPSFTLSFTFLPSGLDDNLIEMFYKNSYILGFDVHVTNYRGIEVDFTLKAKDDKLKLLKERLICLFKDKYNLSYEGYEDMYVTIHELDIDTQYLIYVDKKTLMNELDRTLNDLCDKIISVKNVILDVYSK